MVNNSVDVVVDAGGYGVLYIVVVRQAMEHRDGLHYAYLEVSRDAFLTEQRARLFAGEQMGDGRLVHMETLRLHRTGCV